jgi:tetratricopeptide (TPR) repeat protein
VGIGKAMEGAFHVAQEAFNTALALAEQLADKGLKGAILAFSLQFKFFFFRLEEALEDSRLSAELTPKNGSWIHAQRLLWYEASLYHLGRVREAIKVGEELEQLASRIGHVVALSFYRRLAGWEKFSKQPDLAQLSENLRKDLDANKAAGLDLFILSSLEQLSLTEFFQGDWNEALRHLEGGLRPEAPHRGAVNVGMLFRLRASSGDREDALAIINRHREMIPRAGEPNSYGSWSLLLLAIEGLYVLGERQRAAALYPLVCELIATGTVCIVLISRFSQTAAGIAAAAARNWRAEEDHFRTALEQAELYPNQLEQTDIRRFHAMMLLDRAARDDVRSARALLIEALESYTRIGMRRHVELTRALVAQTDAETI